MANEDRFKPAAVATLAKRAANRCSNPDCDATTSGPTEDPSGSVNVGEAAHIYGANPGSARFDPDMTAAGRSDISNAIWLCKICHKLVDDDPNKYPAGLLFEWQRAHERKIANEVGRAGAAIRKRYEDRHLDEFGQLSYLAERLILEKGDFWEYKLTGEMLRFEMAPIIQRWSALKRNLYIRPHVRIEGQNFLGWIQARNTEVQALVPAVTGLVNDEFLRAWGAPGVPGDDREIVATCRLAAEICKSALKWEESVRFVSVDQSLDEIVALYSGIAGVIIEEMKKIPDFINDIFVSAPAAGTYQLSLKISIPDHWANAVMSAMEKAKRLGAFS